MDQLLWKKIEAFDFDNSPGDYGFSTRLAHENYWTLNFTKQAVLEYKKFMYLAATSDLMVSPSEVIDKVWHQHLVFTQLYKDFCDIIEKQIQHIPSTHNKEEYLKFKQAKERTIKLYEKDFGVQPKNIWNHGDMFDSLNLKKARFKIRSFLIAGILAFVILIAPFYFLLYPVYRTIANPYFLVGLLTSTVLVFSVLEFYNRKKLNSILLEAEETSFIFQLHPYELIYLQTTQLSRAINSTINTLIEKGEILVNADYSLSRGEKRHSKEPTELQVISSMNVSTSTFYPDLLRTASAKPAFRNFPNSMDALKKYVNKSVKFGKLFYTNFSIVTLLILLSTTRLITGLMRDKPVDLIFVFTVVLFITSYLWLNKLTGQFTLKTIPDYYKAKLLNKQKIEQDPQWEHFLYSGVAYAAAFIPVVSFYGRKAAADQDSTFSSGCGSSCGSSCSSCSSCGGCGN